MNKLPGILKAAKCYGLEACTGQAAATADADIILAWMKTAFSKNSFSHPHFSSVGSSQILLQN